MWTSQRPSGRLPALPDAHSHRPTADEQKTSVSSPSSSQKTFFPDVDPDVVMSTRRSAHSSSVEPQAVSSARILQVEGRLAATERGNRALLEELVRWQSDLKASARRQDDIWREERREVLQLAENTRANNDALAQLHQRMKVTEESNFALRQALAASRDQVQRLEQKFVEHSHAQSSRLDQLAFRFDRWEHDNRHSADRANRVHEELERRTAAFGEELRQIKSRQQMTGVEMQSALSELRTNVKRLETEQRGMLEGAGQFQTQLSRLQGTMEKLAPAIGQSISDLKTGLTDLEKRTSFNEQDQSNQFVLIRQSLSKLEASDQSSYQQNSQRFTEQQQAIDELVSRLSDNQTRVNEQLHSLAEKHHSDLKEGQSKTREEINNHFLEMQKVLEKEHAANEGRTVECRQDIAARSALLEKSMIEQMEEIKGWIKSQRSKLEHGFQQLSEGVRLAEQQTERSRHELEKVLHAEIQSRRRDSERQNNASQHVGQRLEAAVLAVQQTQASLSAQITDGAEKSRLEWKKELAEHSERFDRNTADVETRLSVFATRIGHIESSNQSRVDEVARSHDLALQQHLALMDKWRQTLGNQVQELRVQQESVPLQMSDLSNRLVGIKADIVAKVETERQSRLQDTASCRRELAARVPPGSLEQQQSEYNRKLSEMENRVAQALSQLMEFETALQTSRTMLNSRIATEVNTRLESLMEIRQDLSRLSGQVEFLLQQTEQQQFQNEPFYGQQIGRGSGLEHDQAVNVNALPPGVSARSSGPLEHRQIFIVPMPDDANASNLPFEMLNQWGVWQAWRWLIIKRRWRDLLRPRVPLQESNPTELQEEGDPLVELQDRPRSVLAVDEQWEDAANLDEDQQDLQEPAADLESNRENSAHGPTSAAPQPLNEASAAPQPLNKASVTPLSASADLAAGEAETT